MQPSRLPAVGWRAPVVVDLALGVLDLVGPLQCLVQALHVHRHAVGRVQALVRVHLAPRVGIACHLQGHAQGGSGVHGGA